MHVVRIVWAALLASLATSLAQYTFFIYIALGIPYRPLLLSHGYQFLCMLLMCILSVGALRNARRRMSKLVFAVVALELLCIWILPWMAWRRLLIAPTLDIQLGGNFFPTLGYVVYVPVILLLGVFVAIAAFMHWRYLHRIRKSRLCPNCRYDLRGATEMRCPECGRPFTLEELHISEDELQAS